MGRDLWQSRGVVEVSRLCSVGERVSSETLQFQEPWTSTAVQTWAESVTSRTAGGKSVAGDGWKLMSSGTTCKASVPPEVHCPQS